jgi:hypothetical protein
MSVVRSPMNTALLFSLSGLHLSCNFCSTGLVICMLKAINGECNIGQNMWNSFTILLNK